MHLRALKPVELAMRRAFLQLLRFAAVFAKRRAMGKTAQEIVASLGDRPSILLLRQDRLGDVLMSTFMIEALRARYPEARIAILLGKNNKGAAPLLPGHCDVFVYSKNLSKDARTFRAIRRQRFDIAIDMMDNPSVTSSILLAAAGARVTVGVQKENAISYDITVPRLSNTEYHVSDRIAELLRPFGIEPHTVQKQPKLNLHASKAQGRVGLNVSGRVPERSLPPEPSARIAEGLIDYGMDEVVIFCAPHDRWRGEAVAESARDSRIRLASHTSSFKEFAEHVATCEYILTVDTSIIQIAAAANIPVLLLFNAGAEGAYPWYPIGVPYEIHEQFPNLGSLEPEPVLALFKQLIAKHTIASAANIQAAIA